MSSKFACPVSGFTLSEIEPRLFSFNSPYGACPVCDGLGTQAMFDEALIIPDRNKISGRPRDCAVGQHAVGGKYAAFSAMRWRRWPSITDSVCTRRLRTCRKKSRRLFCAAPATKTSKCTYHDGARSFAVTKPFEGVIPKIWSGVSAAS